MNFTQSDESSEPLKINLPTAPKIRRGKGSQVELSSITYGQRIPPIRAVNEQTPKITLLEYNQLNYCVKI